MRWDDHYIFWGVCFTLLDAPLRVATIPRYLPYTMKEKSEGTSFLDRDFL